MSTNQKYPETPQPSTSISRRTVMTGTAVLAAAGAAGEALAYPAAPEALPTLPTVLEPETQLDRIDRLAGELADALEAWAGRSRNEWHVVVPRASLDGPYPYFIMAAAPSYRRDGRTA